MISGRAGSPSAGWRVGVVMALLVGMVLNVERGGAALADDFKDDTLDATRWQAMIPPSPYGGDASKSVLEQNQRIEFDNRGWLATVDPFDPQALPSLPVTGPFVLNASSDTFTIQLRSGLAEATCEGPAFGLVLQAVADAQHLIRLFARGSGERVLDNEDAVALPFPLVKGTPYRFNVVDTGSEVTLGNGEVGHPDHSASVSRSIIGDTATEDYIVFYNDEFGNTGSPAYPDYVDVTIPESASAVVAALASFRRRRALR